MNRYIVVALDEMGAELFEELAILQFVEESAGGQAVFCLGPVQVKVTEDMEVTVSAHWCPGSDALSILVQRGITTMGSLKGGWITGDPYLGLQLDERCFLHFNCKCG